MNIGIDIDGVILDSEKVFRTVADLYNTIELNDRAIRAYDEPRVQEKYNWTDEEIQEFADKYFIECSKISNFMPSTSSVMVGFPAKVMHSSPRIGPSRFFDLFTLITTLSRLNSTPAKGPSS